MRLELRQCMEKAYNKLKIKETRKKQNDDRYTMEWAGGLVQTYKAFEKQVMVQRQKYNTIARYKDDVEMNMELANEHRMQDPLLEIPATKIVWIGTRRKKKKKRRRERR